MRWSAAHIGATLQGLYALTAGGVEPRPYGQLGSRWAGDREGRPYGRIIASALRRDDVGIVPYGCVARSAVGRDDVGSESSAASGRRSGEIGEAPPVADAASRFRGSAPIGGHDSGLERVAAVKIGGARRKAAQKFWAPQQDHRPLRIWFIPNMVYTFYFHIQKSERKRVL